MKIHADLKQNTLVQTNELEWIPSPMKGVERKMIERDGEELARATSLVSYEADSSFSEHIHDLGEEFIVLEGCFSDETGDFPKGSYVRNPAGSKHAPHSKKGCVIFVKLRQFHPEDQSYVRKNIYNETWKDLGKVELLELHKFGSENVAMIRVKEDTQLSNKAKLNGLELFHLEGEDKGQWQRIAPQEDISTELKAKSLIFIKTGHLPNVSIEEHSFQWTELFEL